MTARGCGRFCAFCEKEVIDFTQMNDADFVAYFRNSKKSNSACGRFTERQLKIEIPNKSLSLLSFAKMNKYVAASVLAVAGLSGKVFGQENRVVQTSVSSDVAKAIDQKTIKDDSIVIRGRVLDKDSEGVIGAEVKVENTDHETMTDLDGNFEISIPKPAITNGCCSLKVFSLGFQEQINKIDFSKDHVTLVLKSNSAVLGDFAVVVKENKWRRFKRWVRNNFL